MDEKISVLQFKTNGEWGILEIRNTLGALQEAVGGYIEITPMFNGVGIIYDDDGRFKGKKKNPYLTDIWGDFIVCGISDGEPRSLSYDEKKIMAVLLCGEYEFARKGVL